MAGVDTQLPVRRFDLVIRPMEKNGQCVVKNPRSGAFFQLGAQEHFLLQQLDGKRDGADVCAAFEREFGQPLSEEDLDGFIEMARQQDLLDKNVDGSSSYPALKRTAPKRRVGADRAHSAAPSGSPRKRQSLLYWRKSIFDPDRLFTWLEPKIRFFWTRGFLIFSAACIWLAIGLLWTNREHITTSFHSALRWETALLIWVTLLSVTMLHEAAHGLTCKHYGGDVHEIGFLLMFFMPCFYCNVSDAWLFKEKSKRLWVTFAGGYFELFLWALAVFVWSLTAPDSFVNYAAFIVVSACGVQSLFNFNPLLKLDGYYLLSDAAEIPNLRQRSIDRWQAHLRRWLWGAPAPAMESRARFLTLFGLTSWCFSLVFLAGMLLAMGQWLSDSLGILGVACLALIGTASARGIFQGVSRGEVMQMIRKRQLRTVGWLLLLVIMPALLCWYEVEDRVGGEFRLRSSMRAELRAPIAAFLREVEPSEGDRVSAGEPVLRLEVPDLESRLAQKRAELAESQALLSLLQAGTRPEEMAAQQERIDSARRWRDVVAEELEQASIALAHELRSLDQQTARARVEQDAAEKRFRRAAQLHQQTALTDDEFIQAESDSRSAKAQVARAEADKQTVVARGVLAVQGKLAEREKELSDLETALKLMQAGSRPEELSAQRARVARLDEELRHLAEVQQKLVVYSPVQGRVTTERVREKIGRYFAEGELIAVVEDPRLLVAEVRLDENSVRRVECDQPGVLKTRGVPLESIHAHVRRIAPVVDDAEVGSGTSRGITIVCSLDRTDSRLMPGMSGYARLYTGRCPLGRVLFERLLGHLRTEYWW